jgi:hypothetical protein
MLLTLRAFRANAELNGLNREGAKDAKKDAIIVFFTCRKPLRQVKSQIISWRTWRLGGLNQRLSGA